MKDSIKKGFGFGVTSGIITTLGLTFGLANLGSKEIIIIGIITIAVADAFSDALGIHISEESEKKHKNSEKEVWESTISTYLSKLIVASLFVIPFLFLTIKTSLIISVIYGTILLTFLSYDIAVKRKIKSWKVITEHLGIAFLVIIAANFLSNWIKGLF